MRKFNNTIIKIASLSIGLTIGLVLIARVLFDLSYDRHFSDIDNIYQIYTVGSLQNEAEQSYDGVSGAIAPGFKAEVPGVVEATRYTGIFDDLRFRDESKRIIKPKYDGCCADTNFFKIFDRPFLAGDPVQALRSWNGGIAISRDFAEKLAGNIEDAIGMVVYNESAQHVAFTVSGVFEDFPDNSTITPSYVLPIDIIGEWSINNWMGNDRYKGIIKLAPGVEPESLAEAVYAMQVKHQDIELYKEMGLKLTYKPFKYAKQHTNIPEVKSQILILSIVALLLILISVLNYILVSVADIVRRSKEVGVRKCYGADKRNIYAILIKETAINLFISLAIGAGLVFAFNSAIETLSGVAIESLLGPQSIGILIVTVVLVFLCAALMPAYLFSRIPISTAFRGYKESKRKWKLALLFLQFGINAFLITFVLVVSAQHKKVISEDVGYTPNGLLYVSIQGISGTKQEAILEAVRNLPGISGAGLSYCLPFEWASGNNVRINSESKDLFNIADNYGATAGFFELMGIPFIEGREPEALNEIAVSRSFVTRMNDFEDWSSGAIGKSIFITGHDENGIDNFTVVGVFEDYRVRSAIEPDGRPIVRFTWPTNNSRCYLQYLVARANNLDSNTLELVRSTLTNIVPEKEHEVLSYTEGITQLYNSNKKLRNAFILGTIIAIIIALLGLIGFILDEANRRSAEIAVRKVNGAQSIEIVKMLLSNVLILAGIAIIIANIASFFAIKAWLQQMAEQIALTPWYFIAADLSLLIVVCATVVLASIRIARMNPTISLKKD